MKKLVNTATIAIIIMLGISAKAANNFVMPAEPICKNWKLTGVVVDGVEQTPEPIMAGDIFYIHEDHTAETVMSGVAMNGTWTINDSGTWITVVSADKNTALRLQILSLTDTVLKAQLFNSAGDITVLQFQP